MAIDLARSKLPTLVLYPINRHRPSSLISFKKISDIPYVDVDLFLCAKL